MSLGSTACQQDSDNASERDGSLVAGVLNGQDDRKELYELDSGGNRDILEGGVAALMWEHRIDYAHPTTLRAVSAGEALSLCADERFAEQPAAAFCSAVLIDDDLILTAGHCLGDTMEAAEDSCKRLLVVFDYYYSGPGELALASADDIYACRQVAFHVHSHLEGNSSDVAVLQLDRKVNAKRQPVALREERPQVGESLIAAATGVGLPLKVDLGGAVVEIRPGADYFVAATDSFEGGSGSPLFSAAMALIGFQVRGAPDWVAGDGCWRSSHSDPPMEQHQLAERAIEDFCGTGWPSERLCRRAPACGDGVCSGPETIQSCAEDCRAPRCGDWICEPSERANCRDDCSAYANVPAEWLLDPVLYPLAAPASVGDPKTPRGGCSMPPNVGTRLSHSLAWLALLTTLVLSRRRCFSDMPRFT
jgi:hypothetical protein